MQRQTGRANFQTAAFPGADSPAPDSPTAMDFTFLLTEARAARERAYAPYSHFAVGAALRAKSGRVFRGCNVENLSYGLSICAERSAVFAAVAAGEKEFDAIAVMADSLTPVTPCGACRQVLAEFGLDLAICSSNLEGTTYETTIGELLPRAKEGILGT